jgi:hypothetical protein
MDNDPSLEQETTNITAPINRTNLTNNNNKRNLIKLYNNLTDTIKATETRLKLDLPPIYIKLKIIMPKRLEKNTQQIKQHCIDFFTTNNTKYLQNTILKLNKIKLKLINHFPTQDPTYKKHINYSEWTQIAKFDPHKTPLIIFENNLTTLKTYISFTQPKYNNRNIITTYKTSKLDLIKQLHSITANPLMNSKELEIKHKKYSIYNPSSYISIILPKQAKYLKLPPYVISTLDKGLNFTPHSCYYPLNSLDKEFTTFEYKLLWQNFFSKQPANTQKHRIPPPKLNKNRLKHNPPPNKSLTNFSHHLKNTLKQKINLIPRKKPSQETINFYKTKLFFTTNPQYIIKPADKGSSIIVMHKEFYLNLGMEFLESNHASYKTLNSNPLFNYSTKINQILTLLLKHKQINTKLHQLIKPNEKLKVPNLYFLPKLHKFPNLSGRPICSGNSHPAENISLYIDYILKPYATKDPLYLKDGPQLLEILHDIKNIPKYALLFSLDVINMYPSIPIQELLNTIQETISKEPQILKLNKYPTTPSTIITLLKTVLYTNFSHFNSTFYKQTHGVAMGTPCACTITDIFMCQYAHKNFFKWTYQPRLYKQYRDDSFGLWLHGETTLLQYLDYLNTLHPSIKFTLSFGKQVQFLDLTINLTEWGSIHTETFYKPTDTFQYLNANSCHPPSIIQNIPKSQFLRHIRNCSTISNFLKHASILSFNLRKRMYPIKLINNKLHSLTNKTRAKIIKTKNQQELKRTPLIITYNSNLPNLTEIIKNQLPPELKKNPPILSYRIKRTVGSYLIKAKFT